MRLSNPVFWLKRQARLLARETEIPLHKALDQVALKEGFRSWSHLAASASEQSPARRILSQLTLGDLVLLGARPGQGKTLLGLELVIEATKTGRQGFFFTLEYNEKDVLRCLRSFGPDSIALKDSFSLDTSDDICADRVIDRLSLVPGDALAVIDYLQLLDQRRRNPELTHQIHALKAFAIATGSMIVVISQIDRSFDLQAKRLPNLSDVRLPNPLDLTLFTKAFFMHKGELRLETVP